MKNEDDVKQECDDDIKAECEIIESCFNKPPSSIEDPSAEASVKCESYFESDAEVYADDGLTELYAKAGEIGKQSFSRAYVFNFVLLMLVLFCLMICASIFHIFIYD